MTFCVVTEVPDPTKDPGNLSALMEVYVQVEKPSEDNGYLGRFEPVATVNPDLAMHLVLNMRVPVFSLGEILVLDEYGREIGGGGRKPSKWLIKTEEFDMLEAAIRRSGEVLG